MSSPSNTTPADSNGTSNLKRRQSTGLVYKPKSKRNQNDSETVNDSSGDNHDDDDTCPVCACELQLPYRTEKCRHTFCYLCLKNVISHARTSSWIHPRCPLCREDLDTQSLLHAEMEADDYLDDIKSSDVEYVWQYGGRGPGAWLYDTETSKTLVS